MAINSLDYIVFDFETSGVDIKTLEPLQLAAVVIDGRSLEIKESETFQSYMKPPVDDLTAFCKASKGALDVNKITQEQLENAPMQSVVWKSFVEYVTRYNKKKNSFNCPIFAGHNILGFDLPIMDRMCSLYGNVDKKDSRQNIYNRRTQVDSLQMCYLWFENLKEPVDYKLGTIMEFLGIPKDGTEHNAITDVKNTAKIISRFLKFHRALAGDGSRFKGAFK